MSDPRISRFPHPFKAAVALSNDAEFMTPRAVRDVYAMLNDPAGLALESAHSLFLYAMHATCHSSAGVFEGDSETMTPEAPWLLDLAQTGYIDTIHAYGDFDLGGFTRRHAERAAELFARRGLKFPVFTNHGSNQNYQNLGHQALTTYQGGDDPTSEAYHLDLLRGMGFRYAWVDDGIVPDPADPASPLYDAVARDGTPLKLFRRYRGLVGKAAPNAGSFAEQITIPDLDRLIEAGASTIYYQHLGVARKHPDGSFDAAVPPYLDEPSMATLRHLSARQAAGDCFVTTTSRLLRYIEVRDSLSVEAEGNAVVLRSSLPDVTVNDLAGVTVLGARTARLVFRSDVCDRELDAAVTRDDGAARLRLSMPWIKLPAIDWNTPPGSSNPTPVKRGPRRKAKPVTLKVAPTEAPFPEWAPLFEAAQRNGDMSYAHVVGKYPLDYYRQRLTALGLTGYGRVLDAGAGFGQWSAALALENDFVVGMEIHEKRLQTARSLMADLGITNYRGVPGNVNEVPFADASFDVVFCYGVLMFADRSKALAEFARVLRPGGRLYICTNGPGWWLKLAIEHAVKNKPLSKTGLDAFRARKVEHPYNSITTAEVRKWCPEDLWSAVHPAGEGRLALEAKPPKPVYQGKYLGFDNVIEWVAERR